MAFYRSNGRPVNDFQDTSSGVPGEAPEERQARQRLLADGSSPINDLRFIQRVPRRPWLMVGHGGQSKIFMAVFLALLP